MRARARRAEGTVDRGHVIRLDPTDRIASDFMRACGTHRFTFNWGLAEWIDQYKLGGFPTANEIKRLFNAIKEEQYPWIMESPRDANSQAFADARFLRPRRFCPLLG